MSKITKKNWQNSFTIVGRARLNDNSFKIDECSDSGWQYNNMNLAIDCGDDYGTVYSNMMGGFSTKRNNVIYVHGKKDDGGDDFQNQFTVDWDDRLNDDVLDTVGDFCFITVGLEQTNDGKVFTKRFLSSYDAIAYIKENLSPGDAIVAKGNIKYSLYDGKVSMQRDINYLRIAKDEPETFKATFIQSILVDEDSVDLKEDVDKEKNCVHVHARVLDYVKEKNGVEIRSQYPLPFEFDYEIPESGLNKKMYESFFNEKPGFVKQVNFEGKFVNSGAVVTATMEDVPDDVKALIDMGLYTEEEILTKYASNGGTERRCVLTRPVVRIDGDEEHRVLCPQIFEERYQASELDNIGAVSNNIPDTGAVSDEDDAWLKELFE